MEKKRKIEIAAEMLRECYGFIGNREEGYIGGLQFSIDGAGDGISVYSSDIAADAFYYPEDVVRIAQSLKLCCHVSMERPYGRQYHEQIVFRIH